MPKTWLITGYSSGIGLKISMAALSCSDTVIATSQTPETHLSDLTTCGATALKLYLTSPYSENVSVVTEVFRQHKNIDTLVNVAGYLLEGSVEETKEEEMGHSYKTNLLGTLWGAAAAGYCCASEAALRAVTEVLRAEVAARGIEEHRLAVWERINAYEHVLGEIKRGFSAFHGRQLLDPVKAGNVIIKVLAGDGGLGVPAGLSVEGEVFEKIEEGRVRAMGEVEGLKEVAGYTDLQGVGQS
ncbi:hypothetical protein B9Z19DRAFT_1133299 [Tuber borchii]|uniref:NAD(P)-binding protein n=1 Tax=Tuber borchii TaxID=42251 RepID=A0A2T6ZG09_TUBBO|nr:hypothetical protein B9Z19DRAFT_1133299 [Tuber borchii]